MLCCILTLLSGCKDDDDNPLRFYNSEYEVLWVADVTSAWKAEMVTTHLQ